MAGTVGLLAERIGGGFGLLTAWVGLPDPLAAGVLAREGFDAVTLDMQHGSIDLADVILSIGQVALAGKPAIVRIPVDAFPIASRALDAGASAVIAPMVNSQDDAERFASFMKFPPVGARSWGPHMALALSGLGPERYLAEANAATVAIAMVETRRPSPRSTTSWRRPASMPCSSARPTCRSRFRGARMWMPPIPT